MKKKKMLRDTQKGKMNESCPFTIFEDHDVCPIGFDGYLEAIIIKADRIGAS
jgi:hypothetical protein